MASGRSVAITGSGGRLGSALVAALAREGWKVHPWSRPAYDLDDPTAAARCLHADRPDMVIHCAAWTDVDGCARDPDLAMRRNGTAVAELAAVCLSGGASLMLVSTNEVFDGTRVDGEGYREDDQFAPPNAYGASKLAGEAAVRGAFGLAVDGGREAGRNGPDAWILRTSWLYGPPGNDFPSKIVAAADRLPAGEPLRVVGDEVGSPTYAPDLAAAIVALLRIAEPRTYHLANSGRASRAEWAQAVLLGCGRAVAVEPIRQADYQRASRAPAWAVLDTTVAARLGVTLRGWEQALGDYVAELCRR